MRVSAGFSGYAIHWGQCSDILLQHFPVHSELMGFSTRLIARYSKEHNISQTDLFLSSGEGMGDTYTAASVTKSPLEK
jgi:hypothetical protein